MAPAAASSCRSAATRRAVTGARRAWSRCSVTRKSRTSVSSSAESGDSGIRGFMTVGFIGLGNMGRPMASNLVRKGFALVVHDINLEPVKALEALGARAAANARDVATASEVVITMLPDSAAVKSVLSGSDGVLAYLR